MAGRARQSRLIEVILVSLGCAHVCCRIRFRSDIEARWVMSRQITNRAGSHGQARFFEGVGRGALASALVFNRLSAGCKPGSKTDTGTFSDRVVANSPIPKTGPGVSGGGSQILNRRRRARRSSGRKSPVSGPPSRNRNVWTGRSTWSRRRRRDGRDHSGAPHRAAEQPQQMLLGRALQRYPAPPAVRHPRGGSSETTLKTNVEKKHLRRRPTATA